MQDAVRRSSERDAAPSAIGAVLRPLAAVAALAAAPALAIARAQESTAAGPPAPPRPSVLLITLDTTRRDFMGFHGRTPSPTPRLDALARESIVFEEAQTTAPLTLPAHASLLTGLDPIAHGVHDNSLYRLPDEARTLAEILAEQGYATGAAVAAFVLDPVFGLDQGFARYSAPPRTVARAASVHFAELRAAAMVDRALADLRELAPDGRDAPPFFYWLHLFDPHAPYDPPAPPPLSPLQTLDPVAVSRAFYEAELLAMDAELGRLFDAVERLRDRLVIVVASDHGEGLGDGLETTHGHFLFDPTVRVPLLLRDPRLAPARVAVPVSLIDVAPTLLARLGVDAGGERFDGLDLSPWLAADPPPPPDRVLALESWYVWLQHGFAPFRGCTKGPLKYVRSQREELFDRAADPGETTNLFGPDEPRAAALARRLAALAAEASAAAPAAPGLGEADRRALQALGYATGGSHAALPESDWSELPDAYAKLDVLRGFDEVATALDRGDLAGATARLRELVQREPTSALFHEQLGFALMNAGALALGEAEAALRRALELDPRRARAWFALARCALARRDGARVEAARAREQDDTAAARAAAKSEREQSANAQRALRECLRLEPTYPEALLQLGRLLFEEAERAARQHDPARARPLYEEVAAIAARAIAVLPPEAPEAKEAAAARQSALAKAAALPGS